MMAMLQRRSFLLVVTLVLLLGLLLVVRSVAATTTTATTPELPLLPPLDSGQQSSATTTVDSKPQQTQVELLMIRLIRTFFGDQVKWSPFIQRDQVRSHHRIVHEQRPHRHLQEELARRRFHLRGNKLLSRATPFAAANHPQAPSTETSTMTAAIPAQ